VRFAVLFWGFQGDEELSSPVSSAKRDEEPPMESSAKSEDLGLGVEAAAEGSSGDVPKRDIWRSPLVSGCAWRIADMGGLSTQVWR
jgi:hypothetical protein